MATVETLLQQFNNICSASSTQAIKAAETRLLQFEKDLQFLPACMLILEQLQIINPIKKLIAIYLQKYAKRVCKQKNQTKAIAIIQQLLAILANSKISIDFKSFVSTALDIIISVQSIRALKVQLATRFLSELKESANKSDQEINFAYLLFCGKAVFGTNNFNAEASEFTKNTFKEYLGLNIRLLKIASICPLQSKQTFLFVHKLIKQYSLMIKTMLKRVGILDIDATKLLYLQQLEFCITNGLNLSVKECSIGSELFFLNPNQIQASKIINASKNSYINCLSSFVRLVNTFAKHANLLNSNPLYVKIPTLLDYFIKSTCTFLELTPYHTIPLQSGLLENIDQLFNLYVQCLRINDFYPVFNQNKNELIEKIALPCLKLTPYQASTFYEDPLQFIQSSLQVVERNIKPGGYTNQKNGEGDDFIRQYETLKTYAAQFLSSLCKFQDGTLTHVISHALDVIQNKINTVYSKSTMLMVISCLKDHIKQRKDLKAKICQTLLYLLEAVPIPVVHENVKKQEDIEYAYLLLAVSKMLIILKEINPNIVDKSFKAGIAVLKSPTVSEVHRSFVLDLFDQIVRIDQGQKYVFDVVVVFNQLLVNTNELSFHLLDSYFDLIKFNTQVLKKKPVILLQGLKILTQHIENEVKKPEPVQMVINKCWNIIRQVGQSDDFVPEHIQSIQQIVLPLVPYIDGVKNLDFQQDILLLMTSFIDKAKRVTVNQQKMFEIIPKIFYNQYFCRFGQAFHTIQLFIYYGSDILRMAFPAVKAIVEMAMTSITQSQYNKRILGDIQNCQGALILQSLVAKCGDIFPQQMWTFIIKGILSRLQRKVTFNFLSSNLYALLALSLVHSLKFFSDQENEIMLTRILSNIGVFTNIEYSPKVMIVGLTQLLMAYQAPFVARRFTQILDLTVSLLQISTNKKENWFGGEQQQDDEKEYCNSIILIKNDMKSLDEFNYFKKKIQVLKQHNRQLLVASISQFPQAKKDFFINILTIQKVANVPRKIFKIKK